MILNDRVSEIYQNYSVCENNCHYNKINFTEEIVSCNCFIKTSVDTEYQTLELAQVIRDSFKDSNLAVIKCYNLVFSLKNKSKNIGFGLLLF